MVVKILIIGCGYIGSVLAKHLSEKIPSAEIIISDENIETIENVVSSINKNNVNCLKLDFSDYDRLVGVARNFDVVIGLAPGRLGYKAMSAAIEASVDMVDLSYMPEDPLTVNEDALKMGITIIPDCGVAPGLSNILIGRAVSILDEVRNVHILVGGLPQTHIPPLNYKITWSVEDLIEEYVRKAKIVKDGKTIEVEALDGLEEIEFPGLGRVEAFYTDGVRTLHHTVKGVDSMWERTLRYPDHAEKIKLLRDLGFFDEKPIEGISPRTITTKLLERKLSMPEVRDLLAMRVEVGGMKAGVETCYIYRVLDYFDEKMSVTAMGRTTAYTASVVTLLLVENVIKEKGVVAPERLGMDRNIFNRILTELEKDGVKVNIEKVES